MKPYLLDVNESESVPYFLWNEKTTLAEFRHILSCKAQPDRPLYIARLLREGRVEDVWQFLSPKEIEQSWDEVSPHLGHRRDFWSFLLNVWRRHGAV